MNEYEKDLAIDKFSLDEELVVQPNLFFKYSEKLADAIEERDKAKEELDLIKAELDADIRQNWETVFDKKPTEAAISSWVIMQTKYKQSSDKLIGANRNVNIIGGAKSALDHKRSALSKLVDLWIGEYYSDIIISEAAKESIDKKIKAKQKDLQAKIRDSIKLKKEKN